MKYKRRDSLFSDSGNRTLNRSFFAPASGTFYSTKLQISQERNFKFRRGEFIRKSLFPSYPKNRGRIRQSLVQAIPCARTIPRAHGKPRFVNHRPWIPGGEDLCLRPYTLSSCQASFREAFGLELDNFRKGSLRPSFVPSFMDPEPILQPDRILKSAP